ncbi:MAG: cytochrome c oxidase subunit I [Acidimicrobiales bacterium]|nr:cytochrome c oxidase subunit I [Acidimicrobiales bacterium]HJM97708.1 cytochrome c oxidase subunit I [Acidimicrobiales bacterium]
MAIVEKEEASGELEIGEAVTSEEKPLGAFTRPRGGNGWKDWLFTVDHKKIGIMYGAAGLLFFVIGGIYALFVRLQLARPANTILSAETYNQVFTMHGVVMIFLAAIPLAAAFANYLLPLQIGARDVAFPRLNAFSFWAFLGGGLFLLSSMFIGGWWENAPDGGWFAYAPNTGVIFSPSKGLDFFAIGLQITGIASLVGAINLIVTVLNMRSPGMTLMKMPVLSWMLFIVQLLLLFAMPVISVALFLLTFDRLFDANFYNVAEGADPLLWQHLFWIFGHPEVYILVLPSFGVISEIIPTFSRKPIFGYPFMVFSGITIGFLGWGVWAHHMFTSGIGPVAVAAFSVSTMFIAVPTGVKILNWLATMWGGRIRFSTPMLYATAVIAMFTIGGLSGVTHALAAADTQQTDTYYIVAHFHYVIFGGIILGFFGGFHFWWPKMFGYFLSEKQGKLGFWVMVLGFNITFGPQHILGLQGMSRRIQTYSQGQGFDLWNLVSTIGSFLIALATLMFVINILTSWRAFKAGKTPAPGPDPWDARSLEWMTASPVPEHNFDEVIQVERQDEFWHRKWGKNEKGEVVRRATAEEVAHDGSNTNVHLPAPSYWPLIAASGLPIIGYGLVYSLWLCIVGGLLILGGLYGWVFEPVDDPNAEGDHHDHDGDKTNLTLDEGSDATNEEVAID